MKVFKRTSTSGWGNRLNIIDENNVFVGFDYERSCCESFGYAFVKELPTKIDYECEGLAVEGFDCSGYVFDPSFFKDDLGLPKYDDGGACAFRLVNNKGAEAFLILYNHHNGYYGHGFEMKIGDSVKYEGTL
jgi:hypothetical protein